MLIRCGHFIVTIKQNIMQGVISATNGIFYSFVGKFSQSFASFSF
jgi:hypothetical protein